MYDEFLTLYRYLFTLWETVMDGQQMAVIKDEMTNLNMNRISDVPNSQEQISAMMKKIEELEQFQKHVLETVANKQISKGTKPPEGMFE